MVDMNAEVIASLTTAAGTLVLAVATFASTRTANRASRVAERSLLAGLQPVLMHARLDDPPQKVGFSDRHWLRFEGAGGGFEAGDEALYLAFAVRNVGSGIAVLQGWRPAIGRLMGSDQHPPDLSEFRRLTRDIYVAAGDLGFWQGVFRDPTEPAYDDYAAAAKGREEVTIDLLYTDMHGGQRTITRFALMPAGEDRWMSAVGRHWPIDGINPR
jgi:hypothetical protein